MVLLNTKWALKASVTAVLNFDNAKGVLIGPENKGLECMFTFMNTARVGTALQGVCAAELAYQNSLLYAKERLSMRSLSGTKHSLIKLLTRLFVTLMYVKC